MTPQDFVLYLHARKSHGGKADQRPEVFAMADALHSNACMGPEDRLWIGCGLTCHDAAQVVNVRETLQGPWMAAFRPAEASDALHFHDTDRVGS